MTTPLMKTLVAATLATGLALAPTSAHADPSPLNDAPALDVSTPDSGSALLESLSDYGGSTVGTDFTGSAANAVGMLPLLPCFVLSLSGVKICDAFTGTGSR